MDMDRILTRAEQRQVAGWLAAYERLCALTDDSPAGYQTARAYVALHPEQAEVVMAYMMACAEQEMALERAGARNPFAHRRGVQLRERHLLAHLLGACRCDHG